MPVSDGKLYSFSAIGSQTAANCATIAPQTPNRGPTAPINS